MVLAGIVGLLAGAFYVISVLDSGPEEPVGLRPLPSHTCPAELCADPDPPVSPSTRARPYPSRARPVVTRTSTPTASSRRLPASRGQDRAPETDREETPSRPPRARPASPEAPPVVHYTLTADPWDEYDHLVVMTITNRSRQEIRGWVLEFRLAGADVAESEGAHVQSDPATSEVTARNKASVIESGATVSFRFWYDGPPAQPQGCTLNGSPCQWG